MKKIVRERLNEIKRAGEGSHLSMMGIGKTKEVEEWISRQGRDISEDASVNRDGSIDVNYVYVRQPLPSHIRFNRVRRFVVSGEELTREEIKEALPRKIISDLDIYLPARSVKKFDKAFADELLSLCDHPEDLDVEVHYDYDPNIKNRKKLELTKPYRLRALGKTISDRKNFLEKIYRDKDGNPTWYQWAKGYILYWQLKYVESKGKEGAYYMNVYEISHLLKRPGLPVDRRYLGNYKESWKEFVTSPRDGWWVITDKGKRYLEEHRHFEAQQPDLSKFVEFKQRNRPNPYRDSTGRGGF